MRAALVAHARAEAPNEACGILAVRGGRADRYVAGRNATPSPHRFELELDARAWAELDEFEHAVFHSHVHSPPNPSRSDLENVGLWAGALYVIYSVADDELAAWRLTDGRAEAVTVDARAA